MAVAGVELWIVPFLGGVHFRPFFCKSTEKVSFNIASEASYVYILSGQKFIKNGKNVHFGKFLKN